MALNFDQIISEAENVSLEDLSIESLIQTDLNVTPITFNDLFKDHVLTTRRRHSSTRDELIDDALFELDVECTDIDKIWDFDITDSLQFDHINLTDFEPNQSNVMQDSEEIPPIDEKEENLKKEATTIRRQSTRIENQTRKKIADQIQRENIRLALEAQLLNSIECSLKQNSKIFIINGRPASPATQRYMSMPTDLDAEEEDEEAELLDEEDDVKSDDLQDKLRCFCRQEQGDRFMVCCDNCLEWFHGDCVGVTKKEGSNNEEFTCQSCILKHATIETTATTLTSKKTDEIVVIDDGDGDCDLEIHCIDDDDCLITKAEEPVKFTSNIFQLIGTKDQLEADVSNSETSGTNLSPSSQSGTAPCLNRSCDTLVDQEKSLYCSKNCIDIYTKMVVNNNLREKAREYGLPKGTKLAKMTRFVLAQPATETIQDEYAAPTEDNLNDFLIKNPTYKVYQSKKTEKTKPDNEKSEKILEPLSNDPTKHIKMVKHFATLFKKSMPLNSFNAEFNQIWQLCIKIEEGLFEMCDKIMGDKYMLKVKELSEYLKTEDDNKLGSLILHNKISVSDLLSMNKEQLDDRLKVIVLDDPVPPLIETAKPQKNEVSQGLSILSDTTHLHGKHLYDIKCKICNGSAKTNVDNKVKDNDSGRLLTNTDSLCKELNQKAKLDSSSNIDNVNLVLSSETVDTEIRLEICSSQSEKCDTEFKPKPNNSTINDTNKSLSNIKINPPKTQNQKSVSIWEGKVTYTEAGTLKCTSYLITRYFFDKYIGKDQSPLIYNDEELRDKMNISTSIGRHIMINGRSQVSVVDEYLNRVRRRSDKEFLVLRLHPANDNRTYLKMFEYFYTRQRCGSVICRNADVKDCFIYPLNGHDKVPKMFLPLIGPGLEIQRPHLLLLIIVRTPILNLPYKPISPRYDQADDFVLKHGINLDKYYQPTASHPVCSSPVTASNDVISWVINVRPDVNTDKVNREADNFRENSPDNVSNPGDDSSLCKSQIVKEVTPKKVVNSPCNNSSIVSSPFKTTKSAQNSSENEIQESLASQKAIETKVSTTIFLQKFADIVMNGPLKIDDKNSLSETVAEIISKNENFDASIFLQMADIVRKVHQKEVQDPSVSDNVEQRTETPRHSCVASDISLQPKPFVYKSQQNCKPETPLPLVRCVSPETNYTSLNQTGCDDRDNIADTVSSDIPVEEISLFCETDIDLRAQKQASLKNSENDGIIVTNNCYLKRKHSSRLYTYYDSFESEENAQEKRLRYFFSPHCVGTVPERIPVEQRAPYRFLGGIPRRTSYTGTFGPYHRHNDQSAFIPMRDSFK